MKQADRKLGRGLSALLGESKSKNENLYKEKSDNNGIVSSVLVSKITAGIYQPRRLFKQEALEELSTSIKENGLIQPIVLRKAGDDNQHYEIIAGERRFRACKLAGLLKVPAIIKKINNHEALEMAIVENVQRSDLTPVEEAKGYAQLIEDFSYTQKQVALKVGKSRSYVANLLRLLSLPKSVQNMINEDKISAGHAKVIINSDNPEKLAKRIIAESLSVRKAETLIRDEKIEDIDQNCEISNDVKKEYVNSSELKEYALKLSEVIGLNTKISYNSFNNNGKITIKFDEIEKVQYLIDRLEK